MSQKSTEIIKNNFKENLIKTISAFVEVEVSAFLDGVGTVQNKQPNSKKKQTSNEKIEKAKLKAIKRFS